MKHVETQVEVLARHLATSYPPLGGSSEKRQRRPAGPLS